MGRKILLYLIMIPGIISGIFCTTSTTINSWSNYASAPSRLNKILVYFQLRDSVYRNSVESKFVNTLNSGNTDAVSSSSISPTGKKITKKELENFISDYSIDAILFIKYLGTMVERTDRFGKSYFKIHKNISKQFSPKGYYELHKTVLMDFRLLCGDSLASVWHCNTKTLDPLDETDLANSLVECVLSDLAKYNFISYTAKSKY